MTDHSQDIIIKIPVRPALTGVQYGAPSGQLKFEIVGARRLWNMLESGEYRFDNVVIEYPKGSCKWLPVTLWSWEPGGLKVYLGREAAA